MPLPLDAVAASPCSRLRSTSVRTRNAPSGAVIASDTVVLPEPESPCITTIAGCGGSAQARASATYSRHSVASHARSAPSGICATRSASTLARTIARYTTKKRSTAAPA